MVKICFRIFVFVSLLLSLGAWALASPIGSDPDGQFHLTSIWCGSGYSDGQCEAPTDESANLTPKAINVPVAVALVANCYANKSDISSACSLTELNNHEMIQSQINNEGRLYPNFYYFVASKFVRQNVSQSALLIRFFNILLFVLLAIGIWKIAPRDIRDGVSLTLATFLIPLGLFTIASNNGSSWTITGISFYWAFLVVYLESTDRRIWISAGFFSALSALMALGSRADGAVFVLVSTVVGILIAMGRNLKAVRLNWMRLIVPLVIIPLSINSYLGAGQSAAFASGLMGSTSIGRNPYAALFGNLLRLPVFFMGALGAPRSMGDLGWLDTQMPELVSGFVLFTVAGVIVFSLKKRTRYESLALIICIFAMLLTPIAMLYMDNAIVGELVQARYVLPLILLAMGVLTSGVRVDTSSLMPLKFRIIGGLFLSIAYAVALHTNMRRYITGNDVSHWNLNKNLEWWWKSGPSPMTVWFFGTVSFMILITYLMNNVGQTANRNPLESTNVLVSEGGLEDESIVNNDLQVHLEHYLHPGSPHLSHSAPWKDFGLLQLAYQMLTVINQPIQNHRAR